LGAPPRQIMTAYTGVLLLVAGVAIPAGLMLGYLIHAGIITLLRTLLPVNLPGAGASPYVLGSVTGFICAMAFALPAFLHLRQVAPMNVIRRDLGAAPPSRNISMVAGLTGFLGLLLWYTRSLELTLWTIAGCTTVLLVFGVLAFVLLGLSRNVGANAGSTWRFALASLQRRRLENVSQILVFGFALMLLLMLVLLRTALLDEWQSTIPEDAPNHFVINIAPEELDPFSAMLSANDVPHELGFAIVRGRIVARNGETAEAIEARLAARGGDSPGPRLGSERNLTWTEALPEDNQIVAGKWWDADTDRAEVSLEEDYARDLELTLGDSLEFDIGGRRVTAEVTSIRRLAWESMRPNFFIIFSPATLDDFPTTYMTSFHLPPDRKRFLNRLLRSFPTVTVIEVDALMAQVQSIIARVTRAVELILYLVLGAGALVLVASIQASRDARLREHALLRALGATKPLVRGALLIEFALLGLLSGLVASFGAELTTYLLNAQVFGLPTHPHPWIWVLGPVLGTALITLLGYASTRSLIHTPPIHALRELG
ncbi:MAG: FtsX-like permease family protein, partial [Pseudomonadota bacterium]